MQVKPLIWIESVIEKFSHSRVEIKVKVMQGDPCPRKHTCIHTHTHTHSLTHSHITVKLNTITVKLNHITVKLNRITVKLICSWFSRPGVSLRAAPQPTTCPYWSQSRATQTRPASRPAPAAPSGSPSRTLCSGPSSPSRCVSLCSH